MTTIASERAEVIPFSRGHIAATLGVPVTRLNNWIDRNRLWPTDRGAKFRRSYRLAELFDLAGFAALRIARIPEAQCARFVRDCGFYRIFHDGDQQARFGYRNGRWESGANDTRAQISLAINMRAIGEMIFRRIARQIVAAPAEWPRGGFEAFRSLYLDALAKDRVAPGAAPPFERGAGAV